MEVLCQISDAVKQGVLDHAMHSNASRIVCVYTLKSPKHILKRHNILQQAYAIDNLRHTVS